MYTASTIKNLAIALGLTLAPCFLSSCSKDDSTPSNSTEIDASGSENPDNSGSENPDAPNNNNPEASSSEFPNINVPSIDGNVAQTAEVQKEYIDAVGKVLLEEFDTKNLTEVIDLFKFIHSHVTGEDAISKAGKKWNWNAVEDWAKDCFNTLTITDLGVVKELDYEDEWMYERPYYNIPGTDIIFSSYSYNDHVKKFYYYPDENEEKVSITEEQANSRMMVGSGYKIDGLDGVFDRINYDDNGYYAIKRERKFITEDQYNSREWMGSGYKIDGVDGLVAGVSSGHFPTNWYYQGYGPDGWDNNIPLSDEQVESICKVKVIEVGRSYDNISKTSRLYQAAKYKGDFKLVGNTWLYSKSDGLKFEFTDDLGKTCVLKLETSGKTASVYGCYDISTDWSGRSEDTKIIWNADRTEATIDRTYTYPVDREDRVIEVPENITVTLTRDGREIFKTVTKTDLDVVSSLEYNINKDTYAASATVSILDYKFLLQKANYSSKTNNAEAVFTASHGDRKLVQAEGNANAKFNLADDDVYDMDIVSGDGKVSVNILGKLQIKGNVLDAKAFYDAIEEAKANDEDASAYAAAIDKANRQIDLNLFFDNGSAKQCKVVLEPVEDEHWRWNYEEQHGYYVTYYKYNYAIQFEDGTRLAFGDYAGDGDFMGTRNLFDAMQEDYEDKLGF